MLCRCWDMCRLSRADRLYMLQRFGIGTAVLVSPVSSVVISLILEWGFLCRHLEDKDRWVYRYQWPFLWANNWNAIVEHLDIRVQWKIIWFSCFRCDATTKRKDVALVKFQTTVVSKRAGVRIGGFHSESVGRISWLKPECETEAGGSDPQLHPHTATSHYIQIPILFSQISACCCASALIFSNGVTRENFLSKG